MASGLVCHDRYPWSRWGTLQMGCSVLAPGRWRVRWPPTASSNFARGSSSAEARSRDQSALIHRAAATGGRVGLRDALDERLLTNCDTPRNS